MIDMQIEGDKTFYGSDPKNYSKKEYDMYVIPTDKKNTFFRFFIRKKWSLLGRY